MRGFAFFCFIVVILATGLALADEESLILAVDKPVGIETVRHAGLHYLTDLGDRLLVEGDQPAADRLALAGVQFSVIAGLRPGDEIFLLRPRSFRDELLYGGVLHEVGTGQYLATIAKDEVDDLKLLPFQKTRLIPSTFPEAHRAAADLGVAAIIPKPPIQSIVSTISQDTLSKYISQMSGHEPVVIGGVMDTLLTRYSYSWRFNHAASYIYERFQSYGLDVEYHNYVVCSFDFYGDYFCNSQIGWAVGSDQKAFKTTDGGLTWTRQSPNAANQTLMGVCFVDTLTGWLSGTAGTIRRTLNGGTTWGTQTSGTGSTLREIFFLDPQNGWVVGYGGTVRRTTNGGTNWTGVTSGVTGDLYGCDFRSNTRGWACGANGIIIYWDGTSWTPQTSGTVENLLDIYFVNDNVGWAAGGGYVVLKTVDGGQHWNLQTVPAEADPFLKGVCFADSLNGWVVGLSGTVIHTSDSGATWEVQGTGTLFGLRWVHFIDAQEGWTVGYGGTILHTSDGGTTWENQRENLPAANIKTLKNIVATKPGTSSTEQVIICGHADDISPDYNNLAPGADDNASGTAAAIEAARVMASSSFKRTIKFIGWSGEEEGLYGSGEYAAMAKARGDDIRGVLNFDMIGYVNVAPEDIDIFGNAASEWLVDFTIDCADAYVPGLLTKKIIDPNESGSDHYMFWAAGYDALLAIEDGNVPYPFYHTIYDTLGNLTMPFCTDVVRMGIAALAELAEFDTTAGVPAVPSVPFAVSAYPNPLNSATTITFALGSPGVVRACVYDVAGKVVKTLHAGSLPEGGNQLTWQGDDAKGAMVAPGIYFARIDTVAGKASAKVMVIR
ncbi:MAG: M20/M25/M40 family metallo-hydrolase [Candidatus Eisenbacteria bacterium]